MNDCMTKYVKEIREEKLAEEITALVRAHFVDEVISKNKNGILALQNEGATPKKIAEIVNQCNGTDLTAIEIEQFQNANENSWNRIFMCFGALLGFVLLFGILLYLGADKIAFSMQHRQF